ncbi:UNVERIFIED_CONTAM: hypothetical protein FKN15_010344 [Acipenser sinensis]
MRESLAHVPLSGPQQPGDLPRGENSKPPPKGSAAEKESDRDKEEKKGVQEPTRGREEPMREREEPMRKREEPMREREEPRKEGEEPRREREEPRREGEEPRREREEPMEVEVPRGGGVSPSGGAVWLGEELALMRRGLEHREDPGELQFGPRHTVLINEVIKSYNVNYKNEWKFDALHKYFETEEPKRELFRVVKAMAELALKLPDICPKAIPLLKQGTSHSLTLSQEQISCLLANAFFCTFPHRNSTHPRAEYSNYPDINFNRPAQTVRAALETLLDFKKDKKLQPQPGSNLWNSDHVKMPNSTRNTFNKQGLFGSDEKLRWDLIKKKLSKLSSITKSETIEVRESNEEGNGVIYQNRTQRKLKGWSSALFQVFMLVLYFFSLDCLLQEVIKSYNVNYKNEWKFDALHKYFETEEPKRELFRVVKAMAELALKLPDICPKAIPLLKQGTSHSLTLSQEQISCLLANAFFCTFPHRNSTHPRAEYSNYPDINFNRGRTSELTLLVLPVSSHTEELPQGLVTFERRSLAGRCDWKHCDSKISKLHITSKGTIEKEGKGMLQVDFACAMVGGGVLGSGLIQEEIRFLTHTELIVSRLFTEKLGDWDALCITGPQCYSEYSGYSDTYSWEGPHTDTTERDRWMRRCTKIVAIDAIKFRNEQQQFEMRNVNRELNKLCLSAAAAPTCSILAMATSASMPRAVRSPGGSSDPTKRV